ncbi:MAG TPA: MFS transporter [Terrimesophilobacter sp.]|jgi:hypothetical protein|uniref:MFS transporter n=1 Tax=Terrimesophilobacter sp. TaxID=2906435 RepID=UPI002F93708A
MWLRRAFYYAQFWAIPVLPLWLLIGRGVVANGVGWEFVVLLFACPVLALAMIIVMGLVMARKTVRRARMLSWADLGVLGAWYLAIIVAGFVANPVTAVLVVVLTVVAFWVAVWQLFVETRRRVNTAFASFDAVQITPR